MNNTIIVSDLNLKIIFVKLLGKQFDKMVEVKYKGDEDFEILITSNFNTRQDAVDFVQEKEGMMR